MCLDKGRHTVVAERQTRTFGLCSLESCSAVRYYSAQWRKNELHASCFCFVHSVQWEWFWSVIQAVFPSPQDHTTTACSHDLLQRGCPSPVEDVRMHVFCIPRGWLFRRQLGVSTVYYWVQVSILKCWHLQLTHCVDLLCSLHAIFAWIWALCHRQPSLTALSLSKTMPSKDQRIPMMGDFRLLPSCGFLCSSDWC